MGAINKPALTELLGIEEPQKLAFMVAFGYPAHKVGIVPLTAHTGVKYYLDENRDYCVLRIQSGAKENDRQNIYKAFAYIHFLQRIFLYNCFQFGFN